MVLSSLILFEIESNELFNDGSLIITLERLLNRWTDDKTVPAKEKLLVKLSCMEEPTVPGNTLSNCVTAAGIFAKKLLNKYGLEAVLTCAFVL